MIQSQVAGEDLLELGTRLPKAHYVLQYRRLDSNFP